MSIEEKTKELQRIIGRNVAAERNRNGWSQLDLAAITKGAGLKVSHVTISSIENGGTCKLGFLVSLASVFNLSPVYLITDHSSETRAKE